MVASLVATWLAVVVESAAVPGFGFVVHTAAVEVEYYAAEVGKLVDQFVGIHPPAGSGDVIMAH